MLPTDLAKQPDEWILERLEGCKEDRDWLTREMGKMEQELFRRMEERGAAGIPSEEFVCEEDVTYYYEQPALTPLLEIFNDADIAIVYTPAHQETVDVDARWDVTRAKAFARRYGDKALAILERARQPKSRRLKFHRREK